MIYERQISKIHNMHFLAMKAYEHNESLIIARLRSKLRQFRSAVSHKKYVDLTEHQIKCLLECSFVTMV